MSSGDVNQDLKQIKKFGVLIKIQGLVQDERFRVGTTLKLSVLTSPVDGQRSRTIQF